MIADYYGPAVAMTIFVVFFSMAMITGDIREFTGGDRLEQYNLTEEDLQLSPDIPESDLIDYDIEDEAYATENITFVDPVTYFNGSQDYNTSKAAIVEDGASSGTVRYNIPEYARVSVLTTKQTGLLTCGTGVRLVALDRSGSEIFNNGICGDTTYNLPDDTQFVEIRLNNPDESVLYEMQVAENQEIGSIGVFSAYAGSFGNAIGSWFTLLTGLPGILLWVSIIFTIIATLIVVEVLLW